MPDASSLLTRFNNIKTLPHVAIRLSKMIADDTSSIDDFEAVIRVDPTLVVRLLRVVNSAYFGLREKVSSISEALVFVGIESLRNMVMVEALKSIFTLNKENLLFSPEKLWLHSATVGLCSQMICERIFGKSGENAFLCGILHDVGIIVEHQVEPDLFKQVCQGLHDEPASVIDHENRIIGTNHSKIGTTLAEEWRTPAEVQKGIFNHHRMLADISPAGISGIIQMAEYFAGRLERPALSGMRPMLAPTLTDHIKDNIQEYRTLSKDLPGELTKAKEIYNLET
nr:HDOD domain-containing protein [uncultured Desulfobacter sp.]